MIHLFTVCYAYYFWRSCSRISSTSLVQRIDPMTQFASQFGSVPKLLMEPIVCWGDPSWTAVLLALLKTSKHFELAFDPFDKFQATPRHEIINAAIFVNHLGTSVFAVTQPIYPLSKIQLPQSKWPKTFPKVMVVRYTCKIVHYFSIWSFWCHYAFISAWLLLFNFWLAICSM